MTPSIRAQLSWKRSWRLAILIATAGLGYLIGMQQITHATPQDHGGGTVVVTRETALPPAPVTEADRARASELSTTFEATASAVSPSVVPIFSEQVVKQQAVFDQGESFPRDSFGEEFFRKFFGNVEPQNHTVRGLGSGVIVSRDGYILTNNHVVDGATKLWVILHDSKKVAAEVIGRDPQTDVAVIKIHAQDLPAAILGNSDDVKVGEWVLAIGNPYRLMHSVTAGIISAKGRSHMGLADYEDFIQTDAAINPGNSGGALADLNGNVIGINTAINTPTGANVGIGFAIPINMAKSVMDQLIEHGSVSRGYLALLPQDIDEGLAKALKLSTTKGALVGDVTPDGPAAKGGIERGDVIVSFGGVPIENATDLRQRVAEEKPHQSVAVGIVRDGKAKELTVELGERPKGRGATDQELDTNAEHGSSALGLSIVPLTKTVASQLGYEKEHGVVVDAVEPGSSAEEAGLARGDLIREVNRTPVSTPKEFQAQIAKLHSGDTAALLVQRSDATLYVGVQLP